MPRLEEALLSRELVVKARDCLSFRSHSVGCSSHVLASNGAATARAPTLISILRFSRSWLELRRREAFSSTLFVALAQLPSQSAGWRQVSKRPSGNAAAGHGTWLQPGVSWKKLEAA